MKQPLATTDSPDLHVCNNTFATTRFLDHGTLCEPRGQRNVEKITADASPMRGMSRNDLGKLDMSGGWKDPDGIQIEYLRHREYLQVGKTPLQIQTPKNDLSGVMPFDGDCR